MAPEDYPAALKALQRLQNDCAPSRLLLSPSAAARRAALRRLSEGLRGLDLVGPPGQGPPNEERERQSLACPYSSSSSRERAANRRSSCPADVAAEETGPRRLTFQQPDFHLEIMGGVNPKP